MSAHITTAKALKAVLIPGDATPAAPVPRHPNQVIRDREMSAAKPVPARVVLAVPTGSAGRWDARPNCGAFLLQLPSFWRRPSAASQAPDGHEFTPSWGYGFIDDKPFNEPPPSGAFLPATQAYPRGYIRDTVPDGRDVRLTVFAFTPGNPHAAAQYHVDEGDFQNASIDRRLDIAPSADVLPALRLLPLQSVERRRRSMRHDPPHRPLGPHVRCRRPLPTPGAGTPPPPTDADRDGVPVPPTAGTRTPPSSRAPRRSPGNAHRRRLRRRRRARPAHGHDLEQVDGRPRPAARRLNSASATRREGAVVEVRCHGETLPVQRGVPRSRTPRARRACAGSSSIACDRRSPSMSASPIPTRSARSPASPSSAPKPRT